MLDDLIQTIETLKERIRKHKDYLGAYEVRTRVSLIDPMLRALGWDVDDPDLVQVEPKTDNGWADYALLGISHRPVAFVEAKKLSENIAAHTQQTVGYAISENMNGSNRVSYCACTNGDDWKVFDLFTQAPVMDVSITGNDSAKAAMKFLGLWRRSFSDGSFDRATEPLSGLVPSKEKRGEGEEREDPVTAGWTPLTGDFPIRGKSAAATYKLAPKAIRFPDEEERPIRAWIQVLRETGLWLTRLSLLTPENCRIKREGEEWYIFNTEPKHPRGGTFLEQSPLGDTGIIMEKDFGGDKAIEFAKQVLKHFGQDPSKVLLRLP